MRSHRMHNNVFSRQLILLLMLSVWAPVQAADLRDAEQTKVDFVYQFSQFITWPSDKTVKDDFQICLQGRKHNVRAWEEIEAKTVDLLPIRITSCAKQGCSACELVYITHWPGKSITSQLQPFTHRGILTVSEQAGFAAAGGVIELYSDKGKLRFRINMDAAKRAGMGISSRLLKLADIVYDREKHE